MGPSSSLMDQVVMSPLEGFLMTRISLAMALFVGCCYALAKTPAPADEPDKVKEPVDITAQVKDMNSSKFASPPTEFRTGHVKPRTLDAKAIHLEEKGFTITLPSGAPIPTPTVYKGKIYISGGFH